jgi:hypothetical protein
MVIFEHINTKKTIGLTYKVLFTFFKNKEDKFTKLYEYSLKNGVINIDYFLVRHPVLKILSFYKNKLYDFYGFEFLSDQLVFELSKLTNIDLFPYKIKSPKLTKEIIKQIRSKETFRKFVQNLSVYKNLDPHLYPQTKYLDYIKYNKIIRIEKELFLLQKDFIDINFEQKEHTSKSKIIIPYLDEDIIQEIYKQYTNDYIIGGYS